MFITENLTFSKEFAEWSKQYIHELKDKEISDNLYKKEAIKIDKADFEHKKLRLRDMLRDEQITQEEYLADLARLQSRYSQLDHPKETVDWYSKMNEIVDLTLELKDILQNGTKQAKRNILSKLGSNLVWNEEELIISNSNSINKLVEGIKRTRSINLKFEPKNFLTVQGLNEKTSDLSPVFSTMLPG